MKLYLVGRDGKKIYSGDTIVMVPEIPWDSKLSEMKVLAITFREEGQTLHCVMQRPDGCFTRWVLTWCTYRGSAPDLTYWVRKNIRRSNWMRDWLS